MASHEDKNPQASSGLLRLPVEILESIFEHTDPCDLPKLSLVCKEFHELSAAQLYRKVNHVMSDSETVPGWASLKRLIGKLESINTSDTDVAKHVKTITLGYANAVEYKKPGPPYTGKPMCGHHCGIFLNSLFVATLKKTISLESFEWDALLEISPTLFQALSKIQTLQKVHVRLHGFSALPAAPILHSAAATVPPVASAVAIPHHHSHVHMYGHPHGATNSSSVGVNLNLFKQLGPPKLPKTLSHLSGLRDLAILDIVGLEFIPGIRSCISSSSSTLRTLKLSFAESLASKAKHEKIRTMEDSDSSDDDLNIALEIKKPEQNPNIDREREAQRRALARIFGYDGTLSQEQREYLGKYTASSNDQDNRQRAGISSSEEDRKFINTLQDIVKAYPAIMLSEEATSSTLAALEQLGHAATQYLERTAPSQRAKILGNNFAAYFASASAQVESSKAQEIPCDEDALVQLSESSDSAHENLVLSETGQLGTSLDKGKQAVAGSSMKVPDHAEEVPSDIVDMEHPDQVEDVKDDQDLLGGSSSGANGETSEINIMGKGKQTINQTSSPAAEAKSVANNGPNLALRSYICETHGMPLESLSIHLIPLNPDVLVRAIDLSTLQHLSLLNVGPQSSLWALLKRLHELRPSRLTSIHTDNVTSAFLNFANCLDKLTELFMFERGAASKDDPKSVAKMDDIRKFILEKHLKHLKRLVIRNDTDSSWCFDVRSLRVLTQCGSNLIELGIGLNIKSFHYFVQQIGGLRSLMALQVFFYYPEYCDNLVRELRACIVDHILHFPYLRINYVGMCFMLTGPVNNHVIKLKTILTNSRQDSPVQDGQGAPSSLEDPEAEATPQDMDVYLRDLIKITSISGVKMWEKEIWAVKL